MFPLPSVWPSALIHFAVCLVLAVGLDRWVAKKIVCGRAGLALGLFIGAGLGLALITAPALPGSPEFATMLAACWTLGLAVPAFAGLLTWRLASRRDRGAWGFGLFTLVVVAATVDAFVLEPRSIDIHRVSLSAPGLEDPLRLVLIADLQTDRPGAFEARVMATTHAMTPDVVLFAGDLIQTYDDREYEVQWVRLRAILDAAGLAPPLGSYVVSGDSEWRPSWVHELRGTGIRLLAPPSDTVRLRDDVDLTGLPLGRTKAPLDLARPSGRYHIVMGHRPDFALGAVDADLILAGHTHGGQVQIPGIGPLLTLSDVPRRWAAGVVTALDEHRTLIVSRGLGMERGVAPRLRFFCRPELVVIDLIPTSH